MKSGRRVHMESKLGLADWTLCGFARANAVRLPLKTNNRRAVTCRKCRALMGGER
jgi:hypothetical protein